MASIFCFFRYRFVSGWVFWLWIVYAIMSTFKGNLIPRNFLYDLSLILALRRLVHLSYVLREALKCIVILNEG
jgi:hypothetical protein